jgi:hypothetical protein
MGKCACSAEWNKEAFVLYVLERVARHAADRHPVDELQLQTELDLLYPQYGGPRPQNPSDKAIRPY